MTQDIVERRTMDIFEQIKARHARRMANDKPGDADFDWLVSEIERLNKWADKFSDAQLKERRTGEHYQRELKSRAEKAETKRDDALAQLAAIYLLGDIDIKLVPPRARAMLDVLTLASEYINPDVVVNKAAILVRLNQAVSRLNEMKEGG